MPSVEWCFEIVGAVKYAFCPSHIFVNLNGSAYSLPTLQERSEAHVPTHASSRRPVPSLRFPYRHFFGKLPASLQFEAAKFGSAYIARFSWTTEQVKRQSPSPLWAVCSANYTVPSDVQLQMRPYCRWFTRCKKDWTGVEDVDTNQEHCRRICCLQHKRIRLRCCSNRSNDNVSHKPGNSENLDEPE